jgi:hypothetical protein
MWGLTMAWLEFPLVRIQLSDHQVVLTMRAWQMAVYLYFWWNFS